MGLVAPSSPFDLPSWEAGVRFLQGEGFRVKYLPGLAERRRGFLAGEDGQRAEEIRAMFLDPEVRAIFAVRGGYGAQRILGALDPETARSHPKIFMGYSDVSCLLAFFLQESGLVTFHGPVVSEMADLSPLTREFLFRLLCRPEPLGSIPLDGVEWIRPGRAAGPLVGGNLSLVCSTLGTPWEVVTEGRILFLEDRGEKPYRVDRMLVQLRQAGRLGSAAAILFGSFLPEERKKEMEEVLRENTRGLGIPVAMGMPVGHGIHNIPLPLGILAEVDGRRNRFSVLEAAVGPRE